MTHLTTQQILHAVDGTADAATQAIVANHAAVCPVCRREFEFQKNLIRIARKMAPASVSDRFTGNVMARVAPRRQGVLATWLLNNMGNVFGMMAVLGTIWAVVANPQSFIPATRQTEEPPIIKQWSGGLDGGYQALKEYVEKIQVGPKGTEQRKKENFGTVTLLILLSIGVLIAGDRYVVPRIMSTRRRF